MNFKLRSKILWPIKKLKAKFSEQKSIHKDKLHLSFGENCLTDNILSRHQLKSFSTPYSSARSNIEYILQLEKDCFKDFLNPQYLKHEYIGNDRVTRLTKYCQTENHYNPWQMKGFEFTHHDVLSSSEERAKLQRRAHRMLKLKSKELNIFYHSRPHPKTDLDLLIEHLNELKKIYEHRCKTVNIFMFTQIIIDDPENRRVEHHLQNGIHIFQFYVLNEWAGEDQDIFWARCDDDLIKVMVDFAQSGIK